MKKTTYEKIESALADERWHPIQKEIVLKWYNHTRKFCDENKILERLYVIREFGLFINKPFQEAIVKDRERYIEYKKTDNRETVTNNRVLLVSDRTIGLYLLRLKGFYRFLYKHTHFEIDKELAYPEPKIVEKKEISKEERHKRRVMALLENKILSQKRVDKDLSNDELRAKYPKMVLPEHNLKVLKDFYNYKITSGIVTSHVGFTTKLSFLKQLGIFLGSKGFIDAERSDMQAYLALIQQRVGRINPSYKAFILDFYRFVYGMFENEQPRKYPEVVSWLYMKRKKINDRLAKAIISDTEIKDMIDTCDNVRDKALIAALRDSSARIGELMNCRIKDIKVKMQGMTDSKYKHHIATITLRGKTGERVNLLHWLVSYLRQWITVHPLRKKPNFEDAPLFVARKESRYGQALTQVGVNKMLQKVAKLAEVKKHIHAHLFRHTNLTHMAKVLSETELKIHAGWGSESNMASVYVHLTEKDVADKILQKYGLVPKEQTEQETMLVPQICPNTVCSYQNPGEAQFCAKCGYPLSLKTAISVTDLKKKEEELHSEIMKCGLVGIDTSKVNDLRELMWEVVKKDANLLEKLRGIANDASDLE